MVARVLHSSCKWVYFCVWPCHLVTLRVLFYRPWCLNKHVSWALIAKLHDPFCHVNGMVRFFTITNMTSYHYQFPSVKSRLYAFSFTWCIIVLLDKIVQHYCGGLGCCCVSMAHVSAVTTRLQCPVNHLTVGNFYLVLRFMVLETATPN